MATGTGDLRAYVDLPGALDPVLWQRRHERDEVPDASPWGLHRLAHFGVEVVFRRPAAQSRADPAIERVARSLRYRTGELQFVEALRDVRRRRAARADLVLGYDERTSVPAVLMNRRPTGTAVLAGVGWLTTRAAAGRAHARLVSAALPRAAGVWAQCAPMLPLLSSEWGVPASRVHFVPFGIDTDFYRAQPPPERPDVVASAGEDRFRDHQLLVDAVLRVRRDRPGVRLELATAMPVDMPADLGVRHTGRLDGAMREVYRRSSVVAVALRPSLTGSGLSVVLEAMASARPVVVTANPGMADYVEDGVTGVLVPPGDVDALAGAIAGLLADPDRAREIGAAAAARVRERFTSEVMAREIATLAHQL